jgi:uncharacterized protein YqgC (DUF456 family)
VEWVWIILGIILCIIGIIGSFCLYCPVRLLPTSAYLLQLFRNPDPFDTKTYWILPGLLLFHWYLDYLIPIWGTKRFGGTKYGAWGCTIGFLCCVLDRTLGNYHRPFAGAFIGELIGGQDSHKSLKAALGSFVGFLLGSFLKIVVCFFMLYWIITSI